MKEETAARILRRLKLEDFARATVRRMRGKSGFLMKFPPYPKFAQKSILVSGDPVRYAAFALAIHRIQAEGIEGSFAEVSVWRGETSKFIHSLAAERTFYLFDTFEGFPEEDIQEDDKRFQDTSLDIVRKKVGDSHDPKRSS